MKKENIFALTKRSALQLWNNPILIAPTLLAILFVGLGAVLALGALLATGFWVSGIEIASPSILWPSMPMIVLASVLLVAVVASIVLAFAYLQAGFLGMIKETSHGKKTSLKAINHYGQKFWARYIGLNILVGLILLAGMVVLASTELFFIGLFGQLSAGSIITSGILGILFLMFSALFTLPQNYLILEDLKIMASIKKGYNTAKKNYWELVGLLLIFAIISQAVVKAPFIGGLLSFLFGVVEAIAIMNFAIGRR